MSVPRQEIQAEIAWIIQEARSAKRWDRTREASALHRVVDRLRARLASQETREPDGWVRPELLEEFDDDSWATTITKRPSSDSDVPVYIARPPESPESEERDDS